MKLATKIREIAESTFVTPARASGQAEFAIPVKDLMQMAEQQGISTLQRTPAFCAAIRTQGFLEDNRLEIVRQDGPASKKSTTLVIHYRLEGRVHESEASKPETPKERAFRLTEKLRGLMKDEIAAHGGAEGYLRWVRGEDEEAA